MFDRIFAKIDAEKARIAHEAMAQKFGEGKDISYETGRQQGVYAGLDRARQLIEQILRDQDKRDSEL